MQSADWSSQTITIWFGLFSTLVQMNVRALFRSHSSVVKLWTRCTLASFLGIIVIFSGCLTVRSFRLPTAVMLYKLNVHINSFISKIKCKVSILISSRSISTRCNTQRCGYVKKTTFFTHQPTILNLLFRCLERVLYTIIKYLLHGDLHPPIFNSSVEMIILTSFSFTYFMVFFLTVPNKPNSPDPRDQCTL